MVLRTTDGRSKDSDKGRVQRYRAFVHIECVNRFQHCSNAHILDHEVNDEANYALPLIEYMAAES